MAGVKGKSGKYNRSKESRLKMSISKKEQRIKPPSNLGKKFTQEHRNNISKSLTGKKRKKKVNKPRDKNYPASWNETLRRAIRERDNYTCQICSKQQGDITHHIHHIDYNKDNCDPKNLVCLCVSCHSKTNYKRNYWKEYFQGIMVN